MGTHVLVHGLVFSSQADHQPLDPRDFPKRVGFDEEIVAISSPYHGRWFTVDTRFEEKAITQQYFPCRRLDVPVIILWACIFRIYFSCSNRCRGHRVRMTWELVLASLYGVRPKQSLIGS